MDLRDEVVDVRLGGEGRAASCCSCCCIVVAALTMSRYWMNPVVVEGDLVPVCDSEEEVVERLSVEE